MEEVDLGNTAHSVFQVTILDEWLVVGDSGCKETDEGGN